VQIYVVNGTFFVWEMIKKDPHQYKPLHTTKFHWDQMWWRRRGERIPYKMIMIILY